MFAALSAKQTELETLFAKGDYNTALSTLSSLRQVIDQFFDEVMVNVDDVAVRQNRLALLNQLRLAFLHVADISVLQ